MKRLLAAALVILAAGVVARPFLLTIEAGLANSVTARRDGRFTVR